MSGNPTVGSRRDRQSAEESHYLDGEDGGDGNNEKKRPRGRMSGGVDGPESVSPPAVADGASTDPNSTAAPGEWSGAAARSRGGEAAPAPVSTTTASSSVAARDRNEESHHQESEEDALRFVSIVNRLAERHASEMARAAAASSAGETRRLFASSRRAGVGGGSDATPEEAGALLLGADDGGEGLDDSSPSDGEGSSSSTGDDAATATTTPADLALAEENLGLLRRLVDAESDHSSVLRGMEDRHDGDLRAGSARLGAQLRREAGRHAADVEGATDGFRDELRRTLGDAADRVRRNEATVRGEAATCREMEAKLEAFRGRVEDRLPTLGAVLMREVSDARNEWTLRHDRDMLRQEGQILELIRKLEEASSGVGRPSRNNDDDGAATQSSSTDGCLDRVERGKAGSAEVISGLHREVALLEGLVDHMREPLPPPNGGGARLDDGEDRLVHVTGGADDSDGECDGSGGEFEIYERT